MKRTLIDIDAIRAIIGVNIYYNGDLEKAAIWFRTENKLLGGPSPDFLIQCGRARKLWNFIEAALKANAPLIRG